MAEKRSVPTALGIVIGPALAYLSYLLFFSGLSEYLQLICLGLFALIGHDLTRGGLSLSGVLVVLLLPALPVAIMLKTNELDGGHIFSPEMLVVLWVASVLLGAIYAAIRPVPAKSMHIWRLIVVTCALLFATGVSYFL